MFNVELYRDNTLSFTTKYRGSFSGSPVATAEMVNNSNSANLDLLCDNSIEIGKVEYETAVTCNIIKITLGTLNVIGFITNWEYIDNGNIRLSYVVDAFTSARSSGLITSMEGLCERVNMTTTDLFDNLQSEPFSPSDSTNSNSVVTGNFNRLFANFEGITPSDNGVTNADTNVVITVSPAIVEYLGITSSFEDPGSAFTQELKIVDNLDFNSSDTTLHCGGVYRGTPLKFANMLFAQRFIRQITSGCGFITRLPANGYSNQSLNRNRQIVIDRINQISGSAITDFRSDSEGNPVEDDTEIDFTRWITSEDIYNCYLLPAKFCVSGLNYPSDLLVVEGFKNLSTMHKFGTETEDKGKLLSYPYYYCRIVTANGDKVNIIPQSNYAGFYGTSEPFTWCLVRYIGGDSPRIMGRFIYNENRSAANWSNEACCDWFTIRSYPSITLSIDNSYNSQIQKEAQNIRKLSATYNNARTSAQLSNPIKQGYLDSVNGITSTNKAQSSFQRFLSNVGGILNEIVPSETLFSDKAELAVIQESESLEVGNFMSADQTSIMGNDFLTQYGVPAFAAFDCGASDAELFTFARYLEEFGQSCNCRLNPLTNAGNILGGNGSVTQFNGKTFYKFLNISVQGNIPVQWKSNIKSLFEGGVYLVG